MPMYDYSCSECGETFKKFRSMKSETSIECPSCLSPKVVKGITQFSSGITENKTEELEKRLQKQYAEIKTEFSEFKKELKEKNKKR